MKDSPEKISPLRRRQRRKSTGVLDVGKSSGKDWRCTKKAHAAPIADYGVTTY